jgi:hypothetical protein
VSLTEATDVTHLRASVIRIFTPDGTLVVETDDPAVKVTVEGDGDLVISGAGPQEVRLKAGSYKLRATKDGKPVKLDRDLVTISRGDREIVKVRLEGAASAAATAKADQGAFVLLGGDGGAERKFDTPEEAVAAAKNGDVIEIRGDGPFETDQLDILGRSLVIRAAPGCRPVLRLSAKGRLKDRPIVSSNAALTLEGLELQRIGSSPNALWAMVYTEVAPVRVANCRFVVKDNDAVAIWGHLSPAVDVRNCEFVGSRVAVGWPSPKEGRLSVENCLLAGGCGVCFYHAQQVHRAEVRLARNTFVSNCTGLALDIPLVPDFFTSGSRPKFRRYGVEAADNVFAVTDCAFWAVQNAEAWRDKPVATGPFKTLVTDLVEWRDQRNLYPPNAPFMASWWPGSPLEHLVGADQLDQWRQFAGPDAGALRGKAQFAGGNVLAQAQPNATPERLLPRHFRLLPQSPGHRAGKDGKDLGADVDLVGPGEAYERWKKTPEYQQWLKETGQFRAEAPRPEPKAFVLLGGDGAAERKFDTLAEAVAAADHGDTIEIRGNGPFETDGVEVRGRALTIRPAPGYRPVLRLSAKGRLKDRPIMSSDAALTLEGLELQRIGRSPTQAGVLIYTDRLPLRVANCRFVVKDNNAIALWGHSPPTVDVRNCEMFGSRVAVETGSPKEGTLSMDNCVLARSTGVYFHHDKQVHRVDVRLTRNTFAGPVALWLNISVVPDFFTSGSRPDARRFDLEVENNVFAVTECEFCVSQGAEAWRDKPVPTGPFKTLVTDLVEWRDRRNVYPSSAPFMAMVWQGGPIKPLVGADQLAEWRQFAGPEAGALRGKAQFAGGDLFAQLAATPERLLPKDFRLQPQSTGWRAGKDGRDLGADVDLVGPGEPYERWKKTPEYQQWLIETGQKKKAAPAVNNEVVGQGSRDPFASDRIAHLKIYKPQDKQDVKSVSPPKGAILLFDGQNLDGWVHARDEGKPATWTLREGGIMEAHGGNIKTTKTFSGRFKLHVEFRVPYMPEADGQDRGNSGVYVQGRYEVQVLDSYGLKSGKTDCGAIWGITAPLVNACKAPTIWQSYDIEFQAATFAKGKKTAPAVITVYQNGIKIHDQLKLTTDNTLLGLDGDPSTPGPIMLQDLGNPVQYRNIWLVEQK